MNARSGRLAFGLTVAAFAWSMGLVAAALFAPFYSVTTRAGSGAAVSTSSTLVDENGMAVLLVVALPALLTAVAGVALHRECKQGSRRAAHAARVCVAVLAVFAIVGAASIGLLALPVALLIGLAASLTPGPVD